MHGMRGIEMASAGTTDIGASARAFFEACETGKGWDECQAYCHDGATFSCQSDALADISALEDYCGWMQGMFGPLPDAHYELLAFAVDVDRNCVMGAAVFKGTHTGEGGPVAATGKSAAADYVYLMQFDGDRIAHMTKVWNDHHTLVALGWI